MGISQMLGNLKNPPEPFEEVIRTHFKLKSATIRAQLDKWLTLDDRLPTAGAAHGQHKEKPQSSGTQTPFEKDVAELKALLLALEQE